MNRLTLRQREVVLGVARSLSAEQIGGNLGITPKTVWWHLEQAGKTLGVAGRDTAAFTRLCIEHGWVPARLKL